MPVDNESGPGVDRVGNPVVDPTKNVLDLVRAESKYQDGMRDAGEKLQNAIRDAEDRRIEDLSEAETRRVDALDAQRVRYETRIAEDLKVNVKTTSDQLAGQLVKETAALYNQVTALSNSLTNQISALTQSIPVQIGTISTGFNARLSELEKFRWETGGKSAVADPALTLALSEMAKTISTLKDVVTRGVGQEEQKVTTRSNLGLQIGFAVAVITGVEVLLHFIH